MICKLRDKIKSKFDNYIDKLNIDTVVDYRIDLLNLKVNELRNENQSLSGRIKILEEQQEIMHNFLVEINKYLVNISKSKDS